MPSSPELGGARWKHAVPSPWDGFRLNATTAPERLVSGPRRAAEAVSDARTSGGRATPAAVARGAACPIVGLGLGAGGYFPPAWGWAALWFGWLAILALVLRDDIALDRRSA